MEKGVRKPIKRFKESIEGVKFVVNKKCGVDVCEDSYEEGELGYVNSWDFDIRGSYDSLQDIINAVYKATYVFSKDLKYWEYDEDLGLYTDATVNVEYEEPSSSEMKSFKNGEINLYNAHVQFEVEIVSEPHIMTNTEFETFS
jgi:hypothetical protein